MSDHKGKQIVRDIIQKCFLQEICEQCLLGILPQLKLRKNNKGCKSQIFQPNYDEESIRFLITNLIKGDYTVKGNQD
jgi:hypothetical protein